MQSMTHRTLLAVLLLSTTTAHAAPTRVVHVVVALCDNANQGIVPVPAALGNGQDPANNLYWGALYGVRGWFDKASEWKRVKHGGTAGHPILERVVWRHATADVLLVADAYDGAHIGAATEDLLHYAAGGRAGRLPVEGDTVAIGGGADLIAYVGHNGLMDFATPKVSSRGSGRPVIVLACASRNYFAAPFQACGATALLWTTGLMAPEAYTLRDALAGWVLREDGPAIAERAAQAYYAFQKCGIAAARRLLVTGEPTTRPAAR